MVATIPSLWPEDIKVDLLPPGTILKVQANTLGKLTQGILDAEVTTVTGEKDYVVHRLDLIAPALDGRRKRVLTATHRADYYPLVLEADCFQPRTPQGLHAIGSIISEMATNLDALKYEWPQNHGWRPIVSNQEELYKRLAEVFRSWEVRSVIESMIALSNERSQGEKPQAPGTNGTHPNPNP